MHDLRGHLLTPGLVDCHNHAVYYGDALRDFELLTQGGTRADMIASGGGVQGLVRKTRAASDEQIYAASAARVARLIANGFTTLESKSGSGLDLSTEIRCLRIARELGRSCRSVSSRRSSALTAWRLSTGIVPTTTSTICAGSSCRRRSSKGWWMPWTASAIPPDSPARRSRACSRRRVRMACP